MYSGFKFGGASGPNVERNYSFSIGFGIFNKNVKFNGLKLDETQYPLFLGFDYELSENLSMRVSGYSQIDKFDDNRAAFIELAWPVTEKIKVVGRYSNYSSEINKINKPIWHEGEKNIGIVKISGIIIFKIIELNIVVSTKVKKYPNMTYKSNLRLLTQIKILMTMNLG